MFYEQAPEAGFVAFVPALPGCHTQGETLEEAERNIKEAVGLYLESLASLGEAIPEEGQSFQGRVTVPVLSRVHGHAPVFDCQKSYPGPQAPPDSSQSGRKGAT